MGICVVVEGPPSAFESLDDVFSFFSFLFSGGDHDKIDAVFPPKTFGDTLMLLLVAPVSPPVFFPKKENGELVIQIGTKWYKIGIC